MIYPTIDPILQITASQQVNRSTGNLRTAQIPPPVNLETAKSPEPYQFSANPEIRHHWESATINHLTNVGIGE
jgi:hypothetical protein